METAVTIPREVKIKVKSEGLAALRSGLLRFLNRNPLEVPILIFDYHIYDTIEQFYFELGKKMLKAQQSGLEALTLRFTLFQLLLIDDLLPVEQGDPLVYLKVKEQIYKEAIKYRHIILRGDEEEKKEDPLPPPSFNELIKLSNNELSI